MAAESVGLAASVAGIVSLGLQIVGGIIKYVDAVESRQEELESVRRQSKALNAILVEVDSVLLTHGQPGAVPDSVAQSMQLFETELSRLQALHTDLADSDPQSLADRVGNKKKKVTYAFKRSRIQELGLRLQKAGDALQLTLNVLDLKVSRQQTDALAAVTLSSQNIFSGVSKVRSEVAAMGPPIIKINDQLFRVQSCVDSNAQLLIAQKNADQRRNDDLLRSFQETNDVVLRQHQEVMKMLQIIQKGHGGSPSREAVVRGLAGKPALLKEINDEFQPAGQSDNQLAEPDPYARPSRRMVGPSIRHYPFRPIVGRVCTCPRLRNVTKSKRIKLGHASFSSEQKTIGHWPACPMAKVDNKKRMTMSFGYSGLVRILSTAVKVSFAMTSGAGGFSISPNFTCTPTVDHRSDPAFKIIGLISSASSWLGVKYSELFLTACIKTLDRLLNDGKVSAAAVTNHNETLMHYAISAFDLPRSVCNSESGRRTICSLFVELVQMLLAYGVAAFTFDLEGMSPLLKLKDPAFHIEISLAVIDVLIEANSEKQPLALATSYIEDQYDYVDPSMTTSDVTSLYELSADFVEVCECGPLSLAVIQDDANAVKHVLSRAPGSIAEIDIFGQTPLHLAAAKPAILETLLKYSDCNILDRRDISGFTALETAMLLSCNYCDNGYDAFRCHGKSCGCCYCVDLLLGAGCDVRMCKLAESDRAPELHEFLSCASELARRKYVYYMKQRRISAMRNPPPSQHASTKPSDPEPNTDLEETTGSSQQHKFRSMSDVSEDMSWVFLEIEDSHLGSLFYHHGFRPDPSCLNQLREYSRLCRDVMDYSYLHWLISHAVDPSFRSSRGPTPKDSTKIGLFGAHFAFYYIRLSLKPRQYCDLSRPDTASWDTYMALTATILREDLTDGCKCCCTIHGCSPFTWMMKGSRLRFRDWGETAIAWVFDRDVEELVSHYSRCGSELTSLTYKAAIRYATFGALGLVHTCCNAFCLVCCGGEWVDRDDVDIVNEEQAPLLDLLEDLVEEFEEKAVEFMTTDASGHSLFPQFWTVCWKVRMEEELKNLEGEELTDAERRGAEEMGVRWTVSQQEAEKRNPYHWKDLEHWFYELDRICPEYVEPWPEELCRVSESP